jgi:BirA family biotin operon repressor/biotin-[acetyl-CoA-carboxylase] ligase
VIAEPHFSVPNSTKTWALNQKIPLKFWDEIDSTNTQAKLDSFTEEQILYLACHQTLGRGRGANTWTDSAQAKTDSLLSSWGFRLKKSPQPIASPLIGLSLFRVAIKTWPHLKWSIKAPNDLYLENKKVAGLLIESEQIGEEIRMIIGLGMNVFSHPGLDSSGCIKDFDGGINESQWLQFLNNWYTELITSRTTWSESVMNRAQCAELLAALNRWPLLQEEIEKVFPDGSIQTPSHTYSWFEL